MLPPSTDSVQPLRYAQLIALLPHFIASQHVHLCCNVHGQLMKPLAKEGRSVASLMAVVEFLLQHPQVCRLWTTWPRDGGLCRAAARPRVSRPRVGCMRLRDPA